MLLELEAVPMVEGMDKELQVLHLVDLLAE
jgi:hypothetical protein